MIKLIKQDSINILNMLLDPVGFFEATEATNIKDTGDEIRA